MGKKTRRHKPTAAVGPRVARRGSRRVLLLGTTGAVLLALVVAGWYFLAPVREPVVRKTADQNVLLITLDTMRADGLSCYGGPAATPNLDRLASLGVRYDFAHAHAVVTLVSHASILTGLYPYQHGVHDNAGFRLPAATPTLASMLKPRGVATGAFIASFALDSRFGLDAGFDLYDEQYGKSQMNAGFLMPERRGDAVVRAAASWIEKQRGRWFAWAHLFDPHAPYDPPEPFRSQYAGRLYYGEAAYADSVLGRLLDAARDPSGRPTLVIVTGDHGEGLGDHGEMTHGLFAYEPTLRVPLIVAQIDRNTPAWTTNATAAKGAVSNASVRHIDILPTILEALEMPRPAGLPGHSLLAGNARTDAPVTSYFEAVSASFNRGWAPLTGVIVDREKYVDLPIPERYDLGGDPGEQANLWGRDPARERTLEAQLRAFGASPGQARRTEDLDTAGRLRALGYISGTAPMKAHYTREDDPKQLIELDRELRRAAELYEQRRPADAVAIYQQVIAKRPSMEVAYTELAMLFWEMGNPRAAVGTLERARQAGADSVAVRTKLGMYLAESGQVERALPLLQETAAGQVPDLDALNALGIALTRADRVDDGVATFSRILELNRANTAALENLATVALQRGQIARAREFLERALDIDPSSPQAHNTLGVIDMKSGNRSGAIAHWKQAVAGDPRNFDALYNLATELVNDGQRDTARPYLERFARTAPPVFYAKDIEYVRSLLEK